MQPDTVIPNQSNPQSWNRYSYVQNNPIRYADPTGHRIVDGCSELAGGCNVTQQTIDDDLRKDNKFRQETEHHKCKAGNNNYCTYYDHLGRNAMRDLGVIADDLETTGIALWNGLTDWASTVSVGDVVESGANAACNYKGRDCQGLARNLGESADVVINAVNMVNNSDPSGRLTPNSFQTPTVSPYASTWTPNPTPTGMPPRPTISSATSTPIPFSPTPSLTSTQPTRTSTIVYTPFFRTPIFTP